MSVIIGDGMFSIVESDEFYTVNTGGNITFKIRRKDYGSSTRSPGDLASIIYKGNEYLDPLRGSQINAGFDWLYNDTNEVSVTADNIGNDIIKITVQAGYLTHYYICRNGDDNIYMGTTFSHQPEAQDNVRFILRSNSNLLPHGPEPSNLHGTTKTIESADIFSTDEGITRSKHYSNQRLKDWDYIGATGSNVGLWIVRGNSEGMSGGPFYRSLLNQGAADQEITYIINYGMAQTDVFRKNILNLYTIVFTDGSSPATPDLEWMSDLNLGGWIKDDKRGKVSGKVVSGLNKEKEYTVGFSNDNAMYYSDISPLTGEFSSPYMIPGEYKIDIFKNELSVFNSLISVNPGDIVDFGDINIDSDPSMADCLWRIGEWDGSPKEFVNGDKINIMHPSDVRMTAWGPTEYCIGTSLPDKDFFSYQWVDINSNIKISFNIESDELKDYRLRIGITTSSQGGRPEVNLNGLVIKSGASMQPKTRNITVGTYRGNNVMYTFDIPSKNLVIGNNNIILNVISGSGGKGWLGPSVSFDAIDLVPA